MPASRIAWLAAAFLFSAVAAAEGEVHEVTMSGYSFVPSTISIAPGDSVHWANTTQEVHTVTSGAGCAADGLFNSGNLPPGEGFGWRFETVGEYPYFCIPHCGLGMTGTVEVTTDTPVDELTWGRIRSLYR